MSAPQFRQEALSRKEELLAQLERVELKLQRAELVRTLSAVEKQSSRVQQCGEHRRCAELPVKVDRSLKWNPSQV